MIMNCKDISEEFDSMWENFSHIVNSMPEDQKEYIWRNYEEFYKNDIEITVNNFWSVVKVSAFKIDFIMQVENVFPDVFLPLFGNKEDMIYIYRTAYFLFFLDKIREYGLIDYWELYKQLFQNQSIKVALNNNVLHSIVSEYDFFDSLRKNDNRTSSYILSALNTSPENKATLKKALREKDEEKFADLINSGSIDYEDVANKAVLYSKTKKYGNLLNTFTNDDTIVKTYLSEVIDIFGSESISAESRNVIRALNDIITSDDLMEELSPVFYMYVDVLRYAAYVILFDCRDMIADSETEEMFMDFVKSCPWGKYLGEGKFIDASFEEITNNAKRFLPLEVFRKRYFGDVNLYEKTIKWAETTFSASFNDEDGHQSQIELDSVNGDNEPSHINNNVLIGPMEKRGDTDWYSGNVFHSVEEMTRLFNLLVEEQWLDAGEDNLHTFLYRTATDFETMGQPLYRLRWKGGAKNLRSLLQRFYKGTPDKWKATERFFECGDFNIKDRVFRKETDEFKALLKKFDPRLASKKI